MTTSRNTLQSDGGPHPIICPACGGENPPDSVFCTHPPCHKALGGFRYVREEIDATQRWHESLAERATRFIGQPQFFIVHGFWFLVWVLINTGLITFAFIRPFDMYPFSLLGIILAAEAIFITGFVLITQNCQNAHADKRAELDYEVNVRTYREIAEVAEKLMAIGERLERLEKKMAQQDNDDAG